MGGNYFGKNTVIIDPKRRRVEHVDNMEQTEGKLVNGLINTDRPKNLREAGPVEQARLQQ